MPPRPNAKSVMKSDGTKSKFVPIPAKPGTTCSYHYTDPKDSQIYTCRAKAACFICGQCSKIDGSRENGHCVGHLGLNQHIPVPGNSAMDKKLREKRES